MKATARWPRVARENAITALRCAVASWFALWWLNAGIGGRHNVPDNLPVGFLAVSIIVLSRDANSLGAWLLLGAVMGISLGRRDGPAAPEDARGRQRRALLHAGGGRARTRGPLGQTTESARRPPSFLSLPGKRSNGDITT